MHKDNAITICYDYPDFEDDTGFCECGHDSEGEIECAFYEYCDEYDSFDCDYVHDVKESQTEENETNKDKGQLIRIDPPQIE